tara:strand:+ start:156 stop:431 length:276 start_codon:yes stop_codon:yes gene_type:complete
MGFKAKARKHRKDADKDTKKTKASTKEGELSCGVKGCDKFADKSHGGRSLSVDDAIDMWGSGGYTPRKGRVRICKSCYRKWKKENKNEDMY